MTNKSRLLVLSLTLIATLIIAACAAPIQPQAPAATTGETAPEPTAGDESVAEPEPAGPQGSVVIAQGTDAASLDPQRQNDAFTTSILSNVFDTLIYRNADLDLEPGLATEWSLVEDNIWEVKLREGVKFHNGEDFTAEDAKFTLERPLNPDLNSPLAGRFSVIEGVDIVDDFTIRIRTNDPYPLLPALLSEWFMVPKDYIEATDADTLVVQPVGTGAYQFVEWVKDDHLSLTANDEHWRGAPTIKDVTFRPIPETSTRVAALQSGDVDVITNVPSFRIPEFDGVDDLNIQPVPSTYIPVCRTGRHKEPGPGRHTGAPGDSIRYQRTGDRREHLQRRCQSGEHPAGLGYLRLRREH